MNELEICKRITEIEKLPYHLEDGMNNKFINTSAIYGDVCEYNPLTDDALCFQLMVKYGVTFGSCQFYKNMFTAFTYSEHEIKVLPKAHENSPNKAVCLAIIEAYKG